MKWFDMLKRKRTPRERDAPLSEIVSDDAPPGNQGHRTERGLQRQGRQGLPGPKGYFLLGS